MSAKSRSSNGFWPSTMNLFRRLKPRQRGKCLGVASGKGFAACDVAARTSGWRAARGRPRQGPSGERLVGSKARSGLLGNGWNRLCQSRIKGSTRGAAAKTLAAASATQSECQGNSEAGRSFLTKGTGFSDGAGADLDGRIGANQPVVNGEGFGGLPVRNQVLGTPEQSFRNRESQGRCRDVQVFLQGFGGGCVADTAQGARRRPGDRGIGVLEQPGNRFDRFGIAPYAQAADDADQGPAFELAKRRAKCFVNGRSGMGSRAVSGQVR